MPNVYKIQCLEKKAYNESFTNNNNNNRDNANGPKQLEETEADEEQNELIEN